ncbi:MAG: uroporphyrinogen-III C-methyltransferase [Pseudomonadota bacterium]
MSEHDDDAAKYGRPEAGDEAPESPDDQADDVTDAIEAADDTEWTEPAEDVASDDEMTESDSEAVEAQTADEPPASELPPPAKTPSRFPAFLALLLALGGLGLSGFLFYEDRTKADPLVAVNDRIRGVESSAQAASAALESRAGELRSEIEAAVAAQQSAAASLRDELTDQQDNLEAAQAALAESLSDNLAAQPPTDREWKLAEAEYLLRIANHRLLMERDAQTAGQLLGAADQIFAELGDFSLYDVRARLADEMLSLKALSDTDLQGLYLQLEALKNNLEALPLRLPAYMQANVAPQESLAQAVEDAEPVTTDNWVDSLLGGLGNFFEYRRLSGGETEAPLLSPDQSAFLEMNLRLMLERAQLAMMRRNQVVYEASLSSAADWVSRYLDTEVEAVAETSRQLESLLTVQLEQDLPDISGSLRALQSVSRGRE